jgi:hypothetical protein
MEEVCCMNFIRTVVNSDILIDIIEIPENLKHRKVEILVLPYENIDMDENKNIKPKKAKGMLERYRNIELLDQEADAWKKAMVNKHENS